MGQQDLTEADAAAPLGVPVPREHNPMLDPANRLKLGELLKRAWTEVQPFDFEGTHPQSVEVVSQPKPLQRSPYPALTSAGTRRFAARHADTEQRAWRRCHHVVCERLDHAALAGLMTQWEAQSRGDDVIVREWIERMAAGCDSLPLVGTAEQVAELVQRVAKRGLDGMALSFEDCDDGVPAHDEAVRPLLVEPGARTV